MVKRYTVSVARERANTHPRITKDRRAGEYRLHIKKVLNYKHWDKRRQKPKR